MRLVTFHPKHSPFLRARVGVLSQGRVVDLFAAHYALARHRRLDAADARHAAADAAPRDMVEFFERGELARRAADEAVAFVSERLRAGTGLLGPDGEHAAPTEDSLRLLAPVPRPRRIRDYLTYEAHAAGSGLAVPEAFSRMPICYQCNVETIIGPEDVITWPAYSDQLDFELEVGFFTSAPGRDIAVRDAPAHIAGVTIFNDVSARDIQLFEMSMNIGPSKGKDFCTAMGPCVVTMDEIDEDALECSVKVNGEVWSRSSTSGRRYSFAEVLAWASYGEPVFAGEFLAVGTVGGGCGLELDRWIAPGDIVELEVSGIGTLRNPVGPKEQPPTTAGIPSYDGAPRVGHR